MKTYHQLTQEERYTINALRVAKCSQAEIARQIGKHPSTVSRELRRNLTTHRQQYRPEKAHSYAVARRRRCRRGSHYSASERAQVFSLIRRSSALSKSAASSNASESLISASETIYRWLRRDKASNGELVAHTRIMSKNGRKRYRSKDSRVFWLVSVISVSDHRRPICVLPSVTGKAIPSSEKTFATACLHWLSESVALPSS